MDECIVTSDVRFIKDDELKVRLVDSLRPSQKLLLVFDCCHSQTILDLKSTIDYDPRNNTLVLKSSNQAVAFSSDDVVESVTVQKTSPLMYVAPVVAVAGVRSQSTIMTALAAVLAAGLLVYLVAVLLRPEDFS